MTVLMIWQYHTNLYHDHGQKAPENNRTAGIGVVEKEHHIIRIMLLLQSGAPGMVIVWLTYSKNGRTKTSPLVFLICRKDERVCFVHK